MLQLCVVAYTCDSVKASLGYLRPAIKQNKEKTGTGAGAGSLAFQKCPLSFPEGMAGKM